MLSPRSSIRLVRFTLGGCGAATAVPSVFHPTNVKREIVTSLLRFLFFAGVELGGGGSPIAHHALPVIWPVPGALERGAHRTLSLCELCPLRKSLRSQSKRAMRCSSPFYFILCQFCPFRHI
jgi:hypothetical protein